LNTVITVYFIIMSTLFGITIGSFLNVVIYRIPAGRQVVSGHSACMTCGHDLAAKDLIPIISWCSLKGKCRYCGAPIASRYTKIESATGLIFLICAICTYKNAAPVFFYPEQIFIFYFVYYILLLLTLVALISAMMIYHDVGKCYWGFPVYVFAIRIVTILLPLFFNKVFTTRHTLGDIIKNIGSSILVCLIYVAITFILFLILRKKYSLSDLWFDFTFSSVQLFIIYFSFGGLYIQAAISGVVYGLLRAISKNTKLDKYVGIIALSLYMLLLVVHYVIHNF